MMTEQTALARGAATEAVAPALDHWREQESAAALDDPFAALHDETDRPMPGGWWLLPVMVMAVPTWSVILWIVFH